MPTSEQIVAALAKDGDFSTELEEFLRDLPKAELHVHFDGSIDPRTLYDYLMKNDKELLCLPESVKLAWDNSDWPVRSLVKSCKTASDFQALCVCRGKFSLEEMTKCFEIFTPIVKGNLQLIEDLAFDFCKRQAQQRVIYTEARYSPHLLSKGGSFSGTDPVDPEPAIDAITKGFRRGQEKFGVVVKQILCCICWRPDWANEVVRLASERRDEVVGVDIAAGEEHFKAETHPELYKPHKEAMKEAQELGLNITIHAGEVGGAENVKTAVIEYGAKRIGHAYQIVNTPDLMKDLCDRNVHIELCPTSSRETGAWKAPHDWEKHPGLTMLENNLSVGFNSDDSAVFDTSLMLEMRIGLAKMKLPKETIVRSVRNSIDAAFCPESVKETLRSKLDAYLEKGELVISSNVDYDERLSEKALDS